MNERERQRLVKLVYKYKPGLDANPGGQCLEKALELYNRNGGGQIYWIGLLTKLGLDFGIFHAYFVLPRSFGAALSSNHADNGFPQYPPFTVSDVRELGDPQNIKVVMDIVAGGRR